MAWLSLTIDALSALLLLSGGVFCIIGAIGLLRMPELYARTHAASLGDTLGAGLILLGLALQAPSLLVAIKLGFVLAFLWITSPIATHALLKAAYARGIAVEDRGGPGAG